MNNINLRWQANKVITTQTIEEKVGSNPIVSYIVTQRKLGTPKKVIMENLMRQGFAYRNIKNAYIIIEKVNSPKLDWRSPTSINDTARMIRRDIRAGRITYSIGMRLLLRARDNLKTLVMTPRDRRIHQLNQEIKITKKLLMNQYANPVMIEQYKVAK